MIHAEADKETQTEFLEGCDLGKDDTKNERNRCWTFKNRYHQRFMKIPHGTLQEKEGADGLDECFDMLHEWLSKKAAGESQ